VPRASRLEYSDVQAVIDAGTQEVDWVSQELDGVDLGELTHDAEWAVARRLLDFPDTVVRAAEAAEPHVICHYLLQLAAEFSRWYTLGNGDIAAIALEASSDATHAAPSLAIGATGSWVVEFAMDRGSPASTQMNPPSTITNRQFFNQIGGGSNCMGFGDSNGRVINTGTYSGDVWTGSLLTNNAAVIAMVVNPAGGANLAPIANAGADQGPIEPYERVNLDGSGSSDPDGPSVTYGWTQLSGPSVSLSSSFAVGPSFMAPAVLGGATLVFGLVVADQYGLASTQDIVNVTVFTATEFMAHGGAWVPYRSRQAHGSAWV